VAFAAGTETDAKAIKFGMERELVPAIGGFGTTASSRTMSGTESFITAGRNTYGSSLMTGSDAIGGALETSASSNYAQSQFNQNYYHRPPAYVTTGKYSSGYNNKPYQGTSATTESFFQAFNSTSAPRRTYKLPNFKDNELDLYSVNSLLGSRAGPAGELPIGGGSLRQPLVVPASIENLDCAKNGYCDDAALQAGYPKELLSGLLANAITSDTFKKVFGDVVDGDVNSRPQEDIPLSGRNGIAAQETQLCLSHEVTIYPKAARNKEDKWMFIVNHDDYVQGVKVEKCAREGESCQFLDSPALGFESACRQKYILRKLVALNTDGQSLFVLDTFKLPSCCVCYMKPFVSDRLGTSSTVPKSSAVNADDEKQPAAIFDESSVPPTFAT